LGGADGRQEPWLQNLIDEALTGGRNEGFLKIQRADGTPLRHIVQMIAATTTDTGLKVRCEIDANTYPASVKVTDAEMNAINIERHKFHRDWNYTIGPKPPERSDSF
jgi:hypothetical protein